MNELGSVLAETLVQLTLLVLVASLFLAFYRLARGPSTPDRVVALDLMALIVVGLIATYAVATDQPVVLDAAVVLALISFLSTVAFARYLEKRSQP